MTSVEVKVLINDTLALRVDVLEFQQTEAINSIRLCLQSVGQSAKIVHNSKCDDEFSNNTKATRSDSNVHRCKGSEFGNIVTDHEFMQMLDEIDEKLFEFDSHSLVVDSNELQEIPERIESLIAKPFVGTKYEQNKTVQKLWFNEFISGNDGYKIIGWKNRPYQCKIVSFDSFAKDSNIRLQWNDYVHIRINLFCSEQYINNFGNIFGKQCGVFKFSRNEIGVAIYNNHRFFTPFEKWLEYMKTNFVSLNNYKNDNKLNTEFKYMVIWNGMYYLLNWLDIDTNVSGFDTYLFSANRKTTRKISTKAKNKDKTDTTGKKNKTFVKRELHDYLIKVFVKTNLFGEYMTKNGTFDDRITDQRLKNVSNALFDGSNTKEETLKFLDELLSECIQDISDPCCYFNEAYSGISLFIVNRLTNAVYSTLFGNKSNKHNKKYKKLYQFLWDYCICNFCYPRTPELEFNNHDHESFYVLIFLMLKEHAFDLKRVANIVHTTEKLSEGTILHRAALARMVNYCELLMKNNFNPRRKNAWNKDLLEIFEDQRASPLSGLFKKYDPLHMDENKSASHDKNEKKGIENQYVRLRTQKIFSLYFMFIMGCNIGGLKNNGVLSSAPQHVPFNKYSDTHCDELYENFNNFDGLKESQIFGINKSKQADVVMTAMVKATIVMLEKKLPLLDDVLVLCFEFCQLTKNYTLLRQFVNALKNSSRDCLDDAYINKNEKVRNYLWFKQYVLSSGIWSLKMDNNILNEHKNENANEKKETNETKTERQSDILLFDIVDEMTEQALVKQKHFIWNSVIDEEKCCDNSYWHKLLKYKSTINKNIGVMRQDTIAHGVKPNLSEADLWYVKTMLSDTSDFDIFGEANTKLYLTRMLILNHSMNKQYQNDIKHIFVDTIGTKLGIKCLFSPAPVKLAARCVVKSETDYGSCQYPSSAQLADLIRCSVCFSSAKDMYKAIEMFCQMIASKDNSLGCIVDIARVKNGMSDISKWTSPNDCGYCDIKFNLIVSENQGKSSRHVIGELQFLLKWLLTAKKIGHKLYSIKRRRDLIVAIQQQQVDYESYYLAYHKKIHLLFATRAYKRFVTELILLPNLFLSLFNRLDSSEPGPILQEICCNETKGNKYFDVLVSSVHHFANNLLGKKRSSTYLKKYFMFKNLRNCCYSCTFYTIRTAAADQSPEEKRSQSKKIESIMGLEQFTLDVARRNNVIIFETCNRNGNNAFVYVQTIFKNAHKNVQTIEQGFKYQESGQNALTRLLTRPHCNEQWLNMLLIDAYNQMKKHENLMPNGKPIVMDKKWIKKGHEMCNNGFTNEWGFQQLAPNQQFAAIIEKYATLVGITI